MARIIKKRSKKIGLPPGTLVHIGERKTEKVRITIIDYDETHFEQQEISTIEECFPFKDKPIVTWINIDGIHQVDVIEKIGKHYDLHPLILEDIVNALCQYVGFTRISDPLAHSVISSPYGPLQQVSSISEMPLC